jgi:hypothetical protein
MPCRVYTKYIRYEHKFDRERKKEMQAYAINYTVKGQKCSKLIDAKDVKSAKNKLGKKHGYKDGRMIKIDSVSIVGYF